MNKCFFICDCSRCNIKSVKELRELSEKIFEILGYPIGEAAFRFGSVYKNVGYSSNKKEYFDAFNLDELSLAQFYLLPKGGMLPYDIKCSLDFSKNKDGDFSITCVFMPQESEKTICDVIAGLTGDMLDILENGFNIRYFCMDKMDNTKRPERFVYGIVSEDVRNSLENSVAHSIQLSHLIHHKLPFLFLFNYFYCEQEVVSLELKRLKEKDDYCYELFFPENSQKGFNEYAQNPEWNQMRMTLTELGIVKTGC